MSITVLGLDPARVSGYSIFKDDKLLFSGVVSNAKQRQYVVKLAIETAGSAKKLYVYAEDWGYYGGGRQNQGLGAGWGRWLEQFELCELTKARIKRVKCAKWREGFFGRLPKRKTLREDYKRMAIAKVANLFKKEVDSDDEAEGILIGLHGVVTEKAIARSKAAKKRKK